MADNRTYIVIFEVQDPLAKKALISKIKEYGFWGRITDDAFAIVTADSAATIRDNLYPEIDVDDRLFVVRSARAGAWVNTRASNKWVKDNL